MAALEIDDSENGARFRVRVKPRASKSRVLGPRDGALEVAVAAPPVDGEANAELTRTLARALSVARTAVTVAAGEKSRHKTICVNGLSASAVRAALAGGEA